MPPEKSIDTIVVDPQPIPPPDSTEKPTTSTTVWTNSQPFIPGVANPDPVLPEDSGFSLGNYNKFLVAAVGLVITYLLQHYGSSNVVNDVVMVATALGVYQVKNG